jgi:hypothetical protein
MSRKEGRNRGPCDYCITLWYLSAVDSFFAATAAIGGGLSDPTPQTLPAEEASPDAYLRSWSIVRVVDQRQYQLLITFTYTQGLMTGERAGAVVLAKEQTHRILQTLPTGNDSGKLKSP